MFRIFMICICIEISQYIKYPKIIRVKQEEKKSTRDFIGLFIKEVKYNVIQLFA